MPIYEFTCSKCSRPFETLVMNANETVACPECGSRRVEKRFSVFGVGAATGGGSRGMNDACDLPAPGECPPAGCSRPDCGAFN